MTTSIDAIFDAAMHASRLAGLADERRRLRRAIIEAQIACGSCRLWMTRRCPREVRDAQRGRWRGPHMNALKCGRFVMNDATVGWVREWQESITRIDAELATGGAR